MIIINMIYFLTIALDLKKNLIKIGYSNRVEKKLLNYMRNKQFSSLVPLKCVCILEGNRSKEKKLHKLLKKYLHHGLEIFWYKYDIIDLYIQTNMTKENIIVMNLINEEMRRVWNNETYIKQSYEQKCLKHYKCK